MRHDPASSSTARQAAAGPGPPRASARSFVSLEDLSRDDISWMLDAAATVKAAPRSFAEVLARRHIGLLFEKHSTRTRVSFDVAIASLGAHPVSLNPAELQMARGETLRDSVRALGRYLDALVFRTFDQARMESVAAILPVVNALTNEWHPCQTLADLQTIREAKGGFAGTKIVFVGDGNNVGCSLMLGAAKVGADVTIVSPSGYEPPDRVVAAARAAATEPEARVTVTNSMDAVRDADVLYTDVWVGMHQEQERDELARRAADFAPYQLNSDVLHAAAPGAIVMHCLPVRRGSEIQSELLEGKSSVVWDQAENRLHTAKAVLVWMFCEPRRGGASTA
ncbi:MAG: ornithine carbamoyltransferase [Actinomycetota bacterium]